MGIASRSPSRVFAAGIAVGLALAVSLATLALFLSPGSAPASAEKRSLNVSACCTVSGTTTLQFRSTTQGQVKAVLSCDSGFNQSVTAGDDGKWSVAGAQGLCTVTASAFGYLSAQMPNLAVSQDKALQPVVLLAGDSNGDGAVNIHDISGVASNFGKASPQPWPGSAGSATLRVVRSSVDYNFLPQSAQQRATQEPLYSYALGANAAGVIDSSGLVVSFSANADLKVWTFKVRTDGIFHNGVKATAKDVAGTLAFHARPESVVVGNLRAELFSIETPDATTVVVRLKNPSIFFPLEYLSPRSYPPTGLVLPKDYLDNVGADAFSRSPIGSGPYKLKQASAGVSVTLEAVSTHFHYGVPKYGTIEVLHVPEETTRIALLKTGRVDIVELSRSQAPSVKQSGFNIFQKRAGSISNIFLHEQYKTYGGVPNPLGDPRVRAALGLALDRQTIVDVLLRGFATPSIDFPVVSWDPAYLRSPVPQVNLARAKQLLAEAGYPNGFALDAVMYPHIDVPEGPEIMEAAATWWEQIGIKVTRKPMDYPSFLISWYNQALQKPTVSGVISIRNRVNAAPLATSLWSKTKASRVLESQELEDLSLQWAASPSMDEYIRIGRLVQQKANELVTALPLFEIGDTYAADPRVGSDWDLGKSPYSIRLTELAAVR